MQLSFQSNINQLSKRYFFLAALVMLLIPVFYLNKTNDLDWGDDYVQYVYQSQHLFDKHYAYKVVVNPLQHAPSKRGVLFSLYLSVNKNIHDVLLYKNLMCVSYSLAGLLVFLFFFRHFKPLESLLLALCVCYNYRNLWLKDEIAAEYLMMMVLYLIFILEAQPKKYPPLLYGFLFASLMSVRFAGLIFLIAYCFQYYFIKNEKDKNSHLLKIIIWAFVFAKLFGLLLLPNANNAEIQFYQQAFFGNLNTALVLNNISIYAKAITYYFEQELPLWANFLLIYPAILFIIVGLIKRLLVKWQFIDCSFFAYVFVLLFWDNSGTANRYLIPVLPLIFFYLLIGLKQSLQFLKLKQAHVFKLCSIYLLIIVLSNFNTIRLFKPENKIPSGPFSNLVKNDFKTIQISLPNNAIIAFYKPLVINLCSNRNSFALKEITQDEALKKADYFLIARNPLLTELFDAGKKIHLTNADTIILENFWLLKLKPDAMLDKAK